MAEARICCCGNDDSPPIYILLCFQQGCTETIMLWGVPSKLLNLLTIPVLLINVLTISRFQSMHRQISLFSDKLRFRGGEGCHTADQYAPGPPRLESMFLESYERHEKHCSSNKNVFQVVGKS